MPGPGDLFAQIQAKRQEEDSTAEDGPKKAIGPGALLAQLQARNASSGPPPSAAAAAAATSTMKKQSATAGTSTPNSSSTTTATTGSSTTPKIPEGALFQYEESIEAFYFVHDNPTLLNPRLCDDAYGNVDTDIRVPLAPCVYRMTDYTLAKKEPITLERCVLKLGVLRCLERECHNLNRLLWSRFNPMKNQRPTKPNFVPLWEDDKNDQTDAVVDPLRAVLHHVRPMEETELGKARFMELLSNCGVYQKVSELILQRVGQVEVDVSEAIKHPNKDQPWKSNTTKNPFRIPQVHVEGLTEFLQQVDRLVPALQQARDEIEQTQTVSFYPGLGELFCPGSKLLCYPEGMEGSPLGCSCVQSWYAEELNKATNKMKRRFVLVIEFVVSVGDELVFVAASDVYPEFHDPTRNVPLKDLTHRKLQPNLHPEDQLVLQRLQQRGEFYASVATHNHYLEYYPNSFFPIIGGGWSNNAVRPLSKGGRVMVDVKRGILEGHLPVRGTSDGMSDTVKEAIKLFEQSKRTGVAVPFRTAILPEFDDIRYDTPSSKKKRMKHVLEGGSSSGVSSYWLPC